MKTFTHDQKHELMMLVADMLNAYRSFSDGLDCVQADHEGYVYRNERLIELVRIEVVRNIVLLQSAIDGTPHREALVRLLTDIRARGELDESGLACMMAEAIEVSADKS